MKMLEFPFPFSLVALNAEITPRKICRESHARCYAIVIFYCGKGGAHFFFYPDFPSRTFTIHRTAGEGRDYFF